jgi:hypothetical protein
MNHKVVENPPVNSTVNPPKNTLKYTLKYNFESSFISCWKYSSNAYRKAFLFVFHQGILQPFQLLVFKLHVLTGDDAESVCFLGLEVSEVWMRRTYHVAPESDLSLI